MKIACVIRYQIDPFQREAFRAYAEAWGRIIPRCGGDLVGYFLPHEGTNDVAWGVIAFDGLGAYEAYRARLKADPEGRGNFAAAQAGRFILREERTFVELVEGTFGLAAARDGADAFGGAAAAREGAGAFGGAAAAREGAGAFGGAAATREGAGAFGGTAGEGASS